MKRSFGNKAACLVLSFLMFVSLLAGVCAGYVIGTIMNVDFVTRIVNESEYVTILTGEIQDTLVSWSALSGVTDETVITNVVDRNRVMEDTRYFLEAAYRGDPATEIRTGMESLLTNSIRAYAETNPEIDTTSKELAENIKELASACASEYYKDITVSGVYGMGNTFMRTRVYFWIAIGVMALLVIVILLILAKLSRRATATVRYATYAVTALSLTAWGGYIAVQSSGLIGRIAIETESTYRLFVDALNALVSAWFGLSLIVTMVALLLIVVYVMMMVGQSGTTRHSRRKDSF